MKIACTYENGKIFQHFGHTQEFKIYQVEEKRVVSSQVVSTMGSGHGALAGFLSSNQVDVLICGGIGGGAKTALSQAGITLYGGCSGDCDTAVSQLLSGMLEFNPDVMCTHHSQEGEHNCKDHGCGSHSCKD